MVPHTALNEEIGQLYLGGNSSTHMSVLWPNLWKFNYFSWARVHNKIFHAFLVMDHKSDYFCAATKEDEAEYVGACYDIVRKVSFHGYTYTGHDLSVVLSANQPIIYYLMHKVNDNIQLCEFKFEHPYLCDPMGIVSRIVQSSPWRSLCSNGNKIYSTNGLCERPYSMGLLKGFTTNEMLYLFDKDHVTIFSVRVLTDSSVYPVVMKQYSQFIVCTKGNITDEKVDSGRLTIRACLCLRRHLFSYLGSETGTIVASILALVLLLLCCILLIAFSRIRRRDDDNKNDIVDNKNKKRNKSAHSIHRSSLHVKGIGVLTRKSTRNLPNGQKSTRSIESIHIAKKFNLKSIGSIRKSTRSIEGNTQRKTLKPVGLQAAAPSFKKPKPSSAKQVPETASGKDNMLSPRMTTENPSLSPRNAPKTLSFAKAGAKRLTNTSVPVSIRSVNTGTVKQLKKLQRHKNAST